MTKPRSGRLRDWLHTYTRDLRAEDLQRLFTRDTREAYQFFARHINSGELEGLRSELASRLRAGDQPAFESEAWQTLVSVAREDLAIAKPGHDSWEGQ